MPNQSQIIATCRAALESPNVRAFLSMIRACEGTADADGVRRLFGGDLVNDLRWHPNRKVTRRLGRKCITSTAARKVVRRLGRKSITSTAAGAFQFLFATWQEAARALALKDFSLASQELAAVWLIWRRKALDDVLAGRWRVAVRKCALEWASLPGSPYGQPVVPEARARAMYTAAGGRFNGEALHAVA